MADSIEIAKREPPPPKVELSPQTSSFEENYARLQKKIEFYLERMGKSHEELLALRQEILEAKNKEQKEAALKKAQEFLAQMNVDESEFEKKVETIENDPLFTEKVEAAWNVAQFLEDSLKKNKPKNQKAFAEKQLAALAPQIAVQNRELLGAIEKNPQIWEEIKNEAQKSLAVKGFLEKLWEDPKTTLEDVTKKSGKFGKEVLTTVENNKIAAAACLIFGVIALANIFSKKESAGGKIWGWAKGLTFGGIATYLGLSMFGKEKMIAGFMKKKVSEFAERAGIDKGSQDKTVAWWDKKKAEVVAIKDEYYQKKEARERKRFEKWTPKQVETLQKIEHPVDKKIYEALVVTEQEWRPILPNMQKIVDSLETKHVLSTHDRIETAKTLFIENSLMTSLATGCGFLLFGSTFFLKMEGEVYKAFCNLLKVKNSPEDFNNFIEHYGMNGIIVGSALGLKDVWRAFKSGSHASKKILFAKGLGKGVTAWPIYMIELGGKMMSGSAKFVGNRKSFIFFGKHLGKIKIVGPTLQLISATGRVISKMPTAVVFGRLETAAAKGLGKKVGRIKAVKTLAQSHRRAVKATAKRMTKSKIGSAIQTGAEVLKKRITKETSKQIAKKLGLKVLTAPLKIIGSKYFWAADIGYMAGNYLANKAEKTKTGQAVNELLLGGDVVKNYGKAGQILMQEIQKLRKNFQTIGSQGIYGLADKNDFDIRPFLGSMREEGTLAEAIHATNARIEKELPDTPLFEIPPELETKN